MWTSTFFGILLSLSASVASTSTVDLVNLEDNVTLSKDQSQTQPEENEVFEYSVVLHKCFCDIDEMWNGTLCEKRISDSRIPYFINLPHFDLIHNITIGIACSGKKVEIDVESYLNYSNSLFVTNNGALIVDIYKFENYCFEDYQHPLKSSHVVAQICMEPPTIPSCCPPGYSLDTHGKCSATSSYNFSPTVMVQNQNLTWPSRIVSSVRNISCTDVENLTILELDNDENMLYINENTSAHSSWTPSLFINKVYPLPPNRKYCVGIQKGSEEAPVYLAKFCVRDPVKDHEKSCSGKTCVRKCCQRDEYFDEGCHPYSANHSEIPQPLFHDSQYLEPTEVPENLAFVYGTPLCDSFYDLSPDESDQDEFLILQTGYLYSELLPEPYPPTRYCVESNKGERINMAVVCIQEDTCHALQRSLYPFLVLISVGFLAITLFLYICIPDVHAKVHGKCIKSHVSALLIAFSTLFIVHQISQTVNIVICKFMASVMQLSFLAAFFWLNVMCFDIWWTFKRNRLGKEPREQLRLRFRLYSLYSWGCPLLIAIVSIIIESLPDSIDIIRPRFGETTCWFDRNDGAAAKWIYFYGIILVLFIANILFFCHVIYILIIQQHDSLLKRNWERLCLYARLFIVMGVIWLTEIVSWTHGSCKGWIATDVINCLQGVLIFVMYICKRKYLKKVRDRWDTTVRHLKEVVRSRNLCPTRARTTSKKGDDHLENASSNSSENKSKSTDVSLGSSQPGSSSLDSAADRAVSSSPADQRKDKEYLQNVSLSIEPSCSERVSSQDQDSSASIAVDTSTEVDVPEVQECNNKTSNIEVYKTSSHGGNEKHLEVAIEMQNPVEEEEEEEGEEEEEKEKEKEEEEEKGN